LIGSRFGTGHGSAFDAAAAAGDVKALKTLLLENTALTGALVTAIKAEQLPVVEYLVRIGVDVEKRLDGGMSPLCQAIDCGANDIARYLLDQGASASGKPHEFGIIPLALALRQRPLDIRLLEKLLEKLLRPNRFCGFDGNGDGVIPLEVAIKARCGRIVARLIDMGADPRHTLKGGKTLIALAEETPGCEGIVGILSEALKAPPRPPEVVVVSD
jgi:ankyrin repeat protein